MNKSSYYIVFLFIFQSRDSSFLNFRAKSASLCI